MFLANKISNKTVICNINVVKISIDLLKLQLPNVDSNYPRNWHLMQIFFDEKSISYALTFLIRATSLNVRHFVLKVENFSLFCRIFWTFPAGGRAASFQWKFSCGKSEMYIWKLRQNAN